MALLSTTLLRLFGWVCPHCATPRWGCWSWFTTLVLLLIGVHMLLSPLDDGVIYVPHVFFVFVAGAAADRKECLVRGSSLGCCATGCSGILGCQDRNHHLLKQLQCQLQKLWLTKMNLPLLPVSSEFPSLSSMFPNTPSLANDMQLPSPWNHTHRLPPNIGPPLLLHSIAIFGIVT